MTPEVLLGFGGNVDVEITWDDAVLTRLAVEHGIATDELDTAVPITDERSLVVSILAFARAGQGGERFVADAEVLNTFHERFDHRWTLGGTGIRAALTLRTLGVPSMVHLVSTNPVMRELLPPGVHCLSSATEDSLHPHLIVQFPRGARVRTETLDVCAPKANRLIYVNDPPNRDLVLSDEIDIVAPHLGVLLVTGLNSMQDPALVQDRLHRITQVVQAMPDGGLVLFEDAGQHVAALGQRVLATMATLADVISMNEDELFGHLGRTLDLHDPGAVESALRQARERIGARTLVVHTQHWAAAVGPGAAGLAPALRSGIVAAGTRYLIGDGATRADHEATAQLPAQQAAADLAAALAASEDLICLPALDLTTDTPTTIGLGDTFVGGLVAALTTDRTTPARRKSPMTVIPLPANRPPERFYRGGTRLAELRGESTVGEYEPEDWVGSATTVHGEAPTGLTRLPDGRLLRDAIESDPQRWLGPEHVAAFGADAMVLVKLLDAGERLPVHAHPDRAFAREHFAASHGKTEAWFLLTGGSLHLALKQDLSAQELAAVLERQDAEEILGLMHEVQVNPGDVVLVPAGVLHAIGAGLLLVELQEPEDFSLMLEWKGYPIDGPKDGHLGIGYDLALQAMERRARSGEEIAELVRPAGFGPSVFPAAFDPYFRLGRFQVQGEVQVEAGFAVVIVLSGQVQVTGAEGATALERGATAVAPHAAGPLTLVGEAEVLICRPPAP